MRHNIEGAKNLCKHGCVWGDIRTGRAAGSVRHRDSLVMLSRGETLSSCAFDASAPGHSVGEGQEREALTVISSAACNTADLAMHAAIFLN